MAVDLNVCLSLLEGVGCPPIYHLGTRWLATCQSPGRMPANHAVQGWWRQVPRVVDPSRSLHFTANETW